MPNNMSLLIQGDILDHNISIKSADFSRVCQVSETFLFELIEEGILEPEMNSEELYFSGLYISRVKKANRLSSDLGINIAGIALILDLLEKIEQLENR
ncbi:MAG: chaperone modulatory protein CbpM [Enterobacterales bacterium]|jgi:chaperone modulatory protein CbpM